MISGIKTAVILVLIIDFIQLLGGGKEYGHFIKLVTGLLVACSLCGGILQLTGSITEDTWLMWLTGEGSGLESVWEEAVENAGAEEISTEGSDAEELTEENTGMEESIGSSMGKVEIKVPIVEDIPKIEVKIVREN